MPACVLAKPVPITEDRAGHDTLLNPLVARRFQDASLERTKIDAIDAHGLARFLFETRPDPTHLHDEVAKALRKLVRHCDRLRQDFDDCVRQLHHLVDLGFPEFTRYVRGLDSMLATCLLVTYPSAHAFARATPRRLAKLRYDGRHFVGTELAEQLVQTAKSSVGQHHGPAYKLHAVHICQDLDLWRKRLADIERDIEDLLDAHEVGRLLTTVEGIGPQSAACIIAAYVGVVQCPPARRLQRRQTPQAIRAENRRRLNQAAILRFDQDGNPAVPTCASAGRRAQRRSRRAVGHRRRRREASLTEVSTTAR